MLLDEYNIGRLAKSGLILDTTRWYNIYGNEFFDPLDKANNFIVNTEYSAFSTLIHKYVIGEFNTFDESFDPFIGSLQDKIYKYYHNK